MTALKVGSSMISGGKDVESAHIQGEGSSAEIPARNMVVKTFPTFLVNTDEKERKALMCVGVVAAIGVVIGILGKLNTGEPDE